MKIFIDRADVEYIREARSWGIIDGVTTNPSHVAKTGRKPLEVYREICVLQQLHQHPLTDIGIDIFLKDWAKVPK